MKEFLPYRNHGAAFVLGYSYAMFRNLPPNEFPPDHFFEEFVEMLKRGQIECERVGLTVSVIHIQDEIRVAKQKGKLDHADLAKISAAVSDTIRHEMKSRVMLAIAPEMQKYYGATAPFGPEVAATFGRAEYDITEAGNCLALSRATACVFHCMRVLEHALCALASQFNVPTDQPQWNEMIERTEAAIRQINKQKDKPENWKDDEQFYSEAASQFMHFKNAWRNYTAHIQFKYTEAEAEAIYRHVRDFMQHIAKRLKEPVLEER